MPGRVLNVRPGLIVGPHNPTDRFTYWPRRISRGGEVLVPDNPELPVQFIDARDLAGWTIGMCEERRVGIYNATGPERLSGAERAALVAEVTGKPMGFVTITEEQLRGGMAQMGLPEDVANAVASIQASFAAGAFDILTGDVERLSGRAPKPLRDVLAAVLR